MSSHLMTCIVDDLFLHESEGVSDQIMPILGRTDIQVNWSKRILADCPAVCSSPIAFLVFSQRLWLMSKEFCIAIIDQSIIVESIKI